jgi:hypothetical protein
LIAWESLFPQKNGDGNKQYKGTVGFETMKSWQLEQKMSLPYEAKVRHAAIRAREFYDQMQGDVYVGLGGLDSITLLFFVREFVNKKIPGVTVSILEDKSIREVHENLTNITFLKPLKSKVQVLKEYGYPIVSKSHASKIEHLQTPNNPKQTFIHAIMTGDMGEQGKFQHSEKIKLPDKWLELFGGLYSSHRPDLVCKAAPFKVSARCCWWMKEKPSEMFQKETGKRPYLGLMIAEGGQRKWGLMKNGCNYFGKTTTRSCPFLIFSKSEVLKLAVDLSVPIPKVYGEIVSNGNGLLTTTRAKRTGCSMCGFGVHIEKRPHRFDRLREDNIREWEFWMLEQGWGRVLSYIGVEWDNLQLSLKPTVE